MSEKFEATVGQSLGDLFDAGGEWDTLLSRSRSNTIFLTSGWLHAWSSALNQKAKLIIPEIRVDGKLVASAVFQEDSGSLVLAGDGPSDYLDIVVSHDLNYEASVKAVELLLLTAKKTSTHCDFFLLKRISADNQTLTYFNHSKSRFKAILGSKGVAPSMDMDVAAEKLRKKSLRRHENKMLRQGELICETHTTAADILPQIDLFFNQHIQRWDGTGYPSLFSEERNRSFYRKLIEQLDNTGYLRFTVLTLDGKLIASHFGFYHGGRYTWYKPTYDPNLAKLSPGEVLIKRLIEQAQVDGASEFDFTIGNEAFKSRFSTKVRQIIYIYVTDSKFIELKIRFRMAVRRFINKVSKKNNKY